MAPSSYSQWLVVYLGLTYKVAGASQTGADPRASPEIQYIQVEALPLSWWQLVPLQSLSEIGGAGDEKS